VFSNIGPNLGIFIANSLLLESTIVIHKTNKITFFYWQIFFKKRNYKSIFFENEVILKGFNHQNSKGKIIIIIIIRFPV
jgi:hypothetical protein